MIRTAVLHERPFGDQPVYKGKEPPASNSPSAPPPPRRASCHFTPPAHHQPARQRMQQQTTSPSLLLTFSLISRACLSSSLRKSSRVSLSRSRMECFHSICSTLCGSWDTQWPSFTFLRVCQQRRYASSKSKMSSLSVRKTGALYMSSSRRLMPSAP